MGETVISIKDLSKSFGNHEVLRKIDIDIEAGEIIRLNPGESITLEPYIYHQFWAEKETCIIGEVSKVNDDSNDNRFYEPLGRYPEIEEDESPLFLLCTEYL